MELNALALIVTITNLHIPEDVNLDSITNAGPFGQWLQFTDLSDGPSHAGTFTLPVIATREDFLTRLAEFRESFAPEPARIPPCTQRKPRQFAGPDQTHK